MPITVLDLDKLAIFGLDADGFVYNKIYCHLAIEFFNRYYNLIHSFEQKVNALHPGEKLTEEELIPLHSNISTMIQVIKEIAQNRDHLLKPYSTHLIRNHFKDDILSRLETIKGKFPKRKLDDFYDHVFSTVMNKALELLRKLCPDVYKTLLLTSNELLTQFICDEVEKNHFTHVGFGFMTNRHSYLRDKAAREINGTGCFMVDIEDIVDEVKKRLPDRIVMLNDLVLTDIEAGAHVGESVQAAKESFFNERYLRDHKNCHFDFNKYIPFYGLSHNFMTKFYYGMGLDNDVPVTMYVMDDRKEILLNLFNKVEEAPDVFPKMEFKIIFYDGLSEPEILKTSSCTGEPDYKHFETVRWMIAQCPITDELGIDSVKDLDLNELRKQRNINRHSRFVLMLDADACLFNTVFSYLILHVLVNHEKWLKTHKNKAKYTIQKKFAAIIEEVTKISGCGDKENLEHVILAEANATMLSDIGRRKILQKRKRKLINLIHQYGDEGEKLLTTVLEAANPHLFNDYVNVVIDGRYQKFEIVSISNRQSYHLDLFNAKKGTDLFALTLPRVKNIFNRRLKEKGSSVTCELNDLISADFFSGNAPGTCVKLIREQHQRDLKPGLLGIPLVHPRTLWDETKMLSYYAIWHFYGDADVASVDDMEYIQNAIIQIFSKHPDLIPKNISHRFCLYNGNPLKPLKVRESGDDLYILRGAGVRDENIAENIRLLAKLCGNEEVDLTGRIDAARTLTDEQIETFKVKRVLMPIGSIATLNISFSLFGQRNNRDEHTESVNSSWVRLTRSSEETAQ